MNTITHSLRIILPLLQQCGSLRSVHDYSRTVLRRNAVPTVADANTVNRTRIS